MSSVRTVALAALFAATALAAGVAQAQVYRIVGPDGKVTFTDRAPGDTRAAAAPAGGAGGTGSASLPLELRRVAGQYPVTLYSSSNCAPCGEARNLLLRRGVPFAEKTITTEQDAAALQRLSGATSLPFATIGQQHLNGFSETEWVQYLDAAGYPKASVLPASYRNPAPSPLVAVQQRAPAAAQPPGGTAAAPSAAQPLPLPNEDAGAPNPAGIRF